MNIFKKHSKINFSRKEILIMTLAIVTSFFNFSLTQGQEPEAPILIIKWESTIVVHVNSTYVDQWVLAYDYQQWFITQYVITSWTVNTKIAWTYTIRYNVKDQDKNYAVEKIRTVTVIPLDDSLEEPEIFNISLWKLSDNWLNISFDTSVNTQAVILYKLRWDSEYKFFTTPELSFSYSSHDHKLENLINTSNYEYMIYVRDENKLSNLIRWNFDFTNNINWEWGTNQEEEFFEEIEEEIETEEQSNDETVVTPPNNPDSCWVDRINSLLYNGSRIGFWRNTTWWARANQFTVVRNTNDSGAWSLREAITEADGPTWIVFDDSLRGRTITLSRAITTFNSDITIDGRWNDGRMNDITISPNSSVDPFAMIQLRWGNVIIHWVTFNGNGTKSTNLMPRQWNNYWFDHITVTNWDSDDAISVGQWGRDDSASEITISNYNVYNTSKWILSWWNDNYPNFWINRWTVFNSNLHAEDRNPRVQYGGQWHVFNNFIHEFRYWWVDAWRNGQIIVENNVINWSNSNNPARSALTWRVAWDWPTGHIYISGNILQWWVEASGSVNPSNPSAFRIPYSYELMNANRVQDYVLNNAGAENADGSLIHCLNDNTKSSIDEQEKTIPERDNNKTEDDSEEVVIEETPNEWVCRIDRINSLLYSGDRIGFWRNTTWWARANQFTVVRNTNDSGAWSLRDAITSGDWPKWIIFDDSLRGRTITLRTALNIHDSDITIDGRWSNGRMNDITIAPERGSILPMFQLRGWNLIIHWLTLDWNDTDWTALMLRQWDNYWMNHLTITNWSSDDAISIGQWSKDDSASEITISNYYTYGTSKWILAGWEDLAYETHPRLRATVFNSNLSADDRNPFVKNKAQFHVFNNYVHNFRYMGSNTTRTWVIISENNVYSANKANNPNTSLAGRTIASWKDGREIQGYIFSSWNLFTNGARTSGEINPNNPSAFRIPYSYELMNINRVQDYVLNNAWAENADGSLQYCW